MWRMARRGALPTSRRVPSTLTAASSSARLCVCSHELASLLVQRGRGYTDATHRAKRSNMKVCVAVAGGGSSAISILASTPGASSILLEGTVAYDRRSFADYVSSSFRSASPPAMATGTQRNGKFKFASAQAASLLSLSALHRSMQLTPQLKSMMTHCIGVGCASALVSEDTEGKTSRSHCHIAVSDSKGTTVLYKVQLSSYGEESAEESETRRRDRREEEEVVANLVLLAMLRHSSDDAKDAIQQRELDEYTEKMTKKVLSRNGDTIAFQTISDNVISTVAEGAQRIITRANDAIVLVPVQKCNSMEHGDYDEGDNNNVVMKVMSPHLVLPPDPIIFPGSFNPPHVGHISLANAAVKTMMRLQRQTWELADGIGDDCMMRNVWNATESRPTSPPSVLFEMSLTNPDKDPMESEEVGRRVELFPNCGTNTGTSADVAMMPNDWGVLLTSAPLFVDKVEMLSKYLAPSAATRVPIVSKRHDDPYWIRKMTFVIGTDTMIRILNPRYYGNDRDAMLKAVRTMGSLGAHFVVGGRLEQHKKDNKSEDSIFVSGREELQLLPMDVQNMFTLIPEEDFRVDISSTELRRKMKQTTASSSQSNS